MSGITSTISDSGRVYLFDKNALPKNFIESGLKMTASGLSLNIAPGTCDIGGKYHELAEQSSLALPQRMACMPYAMRSDLADEPTLGYVQAAFPAADAGTVCRWIIDGSATIASTVGSNNLTRSGAVTQVDGWIGYGGKGDGSTGYYTSANSTGFPTGAAAREIDFVFTFQNKAARHTLGGQQAGFYLDFSNGGTRPYIYYLTSVGNTADTGFDCEEGKTYYAALCYDGTKALLYINGILVFVSAAFALNVASLMTFLRMDPSEGFYSPCTIHYVELRNALRTPAQIAAISNALLLPCRYYPDPAKTDFTDIRSLLPANTISLGFARTNSSQVVDLDDSSYKTGRREGTVGGNRQVFLGWKYFSGSVTLAWDNPFGTRKVKNQFVWASDANGTGECDASPNWMHTSGTYFGLQPAYTSASRIRVITNPGGVTIINGTTWMTSGYLGCYAEVIE